METNIYRLKWYITEFVWYTMEVNVNPSLELHQGHILGPIWPNFGPTLTSLVTRGRNFSDETIISVEKQQT